MATEKLSDIALTVPVVGGWIYSVDGGTRRRNLIEKVAELGLARTQERTKQHNFNATSLTSLGADSVTNGGFDSDTGWVKGTGWTIAAGVANSDGTQTGDSDLENTGNAPVAGKVYEVVYTVTNRTAGNVVAVVGNQEGTDQNTNATFTELITASNTDILKIRADLDFDGDIDVVTMKLAQISWDLDDNEHCKITLDQNMLMDNPTNMVDGGEYILRILQDGTGTRTITWGSAFKWSGGTAPTLTTTATTGFDIIRFVCDGSSMYGNAIVNFS